MMQVQLHNFAITLQKLCRLALDPRSSTSLKFRAVRAICRVLVQFTDHPHKPYTTAQIKFLLNFIAGDIRELLFTACRGGGKTELAVIALFIICVGEPHTRGLWLSGDTMQMSEARNKIEVWIDNAFVGLAKLVRNADTNQMRLEFTNGSFCDFNPTTKVNGPRCNLLFFDEEGKIKDANLVRNNKLAYKVTKGTFRHPIRIRHFTTLAIATPAAVVYKSLNKRGLVLLFPATDPRDEYQHEKFTDICPWVEVTEEDLRWGTGNVNCELLCKLDDPEGKRILAPVIIVDYIPDWINRPTPGWYCRITIDWNATANHAVEVVITNTDEYWIIDEWHGTDLSAMAGFINRYRSRYGELCLVIQEWQGGKTQSRQYDLETYFNCRIDMKDPWDGPTQQTKIPLAQGLTERGKVLVWKGCHVFIEQAETFCFDDKGKIPDGLEDHAVVSFIHAIATVNTFDLSAPAGVYEEI